MSERGKAGGAGERRSAVAGARAALAALVLLCAADVAAQAEDEGRFEALEAKEELIDGVYHVSALLYLRLPSDATRALQSTLPLTIRIEVQFLNRLWFWWDNAEFERIVRYRLTYNSVADRYVVDIEPPEGDEKGKFYGTGDEPMRQTFPTVAAALEHIGRVDRLAVVEASELDRNLRYDIRIRAALDHDELPGPLRLLAFWRKDWSISSEWESWRLDAQ